MGGDTFGKGGGSAPQVPDFYAAADATAQASQRAVNQQTQANRPNQSNPWGNSTWQQGPNGQWTQRTTLNPMDQASLDSQRWTQLGASNLANDYMNQAQANPLNVNQVAGGQSLTGGPIQGGLDFGSLGGMPQAQAMNQAGVDAVYNQATSRLDPQFAQREESMRAQLANQGLDPGTEAYNAEMGNFTRGRNDAYSGAMNNAITQGAQIGSSMFGQGMQARQQGASEIGQAGNFANAAQGQGFGQNAQAQSFQNALHQQGITDQTTAAQFPVAMAQQALAGQQVQNPQFAQFSQAGQAQSPNYLGAAGMGYQAATGAYGQDQAGKNSKMSGAASLAPAAMAASDERLKTEIERLPIEAAAGIPLARWAWRDGGSPGFGVIAQDVERVRPELVSRRGDGMRIVNYGALFGARGA